MEYTQDVAPPGDLLDQDWSETFRAKLLVYAQEIDFGAFEKFGADTKSDRDTGYESDELAGLARANTDMPFLSPAWRFESPSNLSDILSIVQNVDRYQLRNDAE